MRHHGCGESRWAGRGRGFSFGPGGFHIDFGDGPGGWGGHRRRDRKRMFEGGELRLVLLKLIADEPRHGYQLIKAIEDMTGGEYAPSPVPARRSPTGCGRASSTRWSARSI